MNIALLSKTTPVKWLRTKVFWVSLGSNKIKNKIFETFNLKVCVVKSRQPQKTRSSKVMSQKLGINNNPERQPCSTVKNPSPLVPVYEQSIFKTLKSQALPWQQKFTIFQVLLGYSLLFC